MTAFRAASSVTGRLSPDTDMARAFRAMSDAMLAAGRWTQDGDRTDAPSVWGMPVVVYVRTDQGYPSEFVGVYEVAGVAEPSIP